MQRSKLGCEKGAICQQEVYERGAAFLSKKVHKIIRSLQV